MRLIDKILAILCNPAKFHITSANQNPCKWEKPHRKIAIKKQGRDDPAFSDLGVTI
jgi:hypothetical protein